MLHNIKAEANPYEVQKQAKRPGGRKWGGAIVYRVIELFHI